MSSFQLATLCYVRSPEKGTLLLHRNKKQNDVHKNKWIGLGGKLEAGESPEECVIREVREESGLSIFNPKIAGVLTFPMFTPGKDWYVFVFTANMFEFEEHVSELKVGPEGTLQWVSDKDLFSQPMWDGDKIFLPFLISGNFFSGKFYYKDGVLVDHVINILD